MKKARKNDVRDGWYLVEPADAQRLLDEQPQNRSLREGKAVRLARDIESGKWRANGETIILDEADKLLDGQGRCRACVISGKPFETYVVHGVPRKMFSTVDTGQSRTGADTLNLMGVGNYAIASAICRTAINHQKGKTTSQGHVTNQELQEFARRNSARIERAISDCQAYFSKAPIQPSHLAWVYMEAVDVDEAKAMEWVLGVALGESLKNGSPMLALRNRVISLKGATASVKTYEKLAWAIKSWNAFIEGRTVNLLKWTSGQGGGKRTEAFPDISDGTAE